MIGSFLSVLRHRLLHPFPLVHYLLLTTETHAFCGSFAFFAMLGFYPLGLLLVSLAKHVLRSPEALDAVRLIVYSYYPVSQDFLLRNLDLSSRQTGPQLSVYGALWILLGGAGVFIPLETAFNRLWGFSKHRSYWHNQLLGFLLTLVCWMMAVLLVLTLAPLPHFARVPMLHLSAVAFGAAAVFLFYRFLPHGRVTSSAALPAAVLVAVAAEAVRGAFDLLLPLLDLPKVQGPYYVTVSFLVFVYIEAFVLLAGAFLAAEAMRGPGSHV